MNPNFIKTKNLFERIYFLLGVGFVSILAQVVILRELNVAFYGVELIYILALGVWLLGTAIGASIERRFPLSQEKKIRVLFLSFAIVLFVDILFIRGIRKIFGAVPGAFLSFALQIFGLIFALIPVGILTGLLFQLTAKKFIELNETLAKAYSIESAGGLLGGLASTLLLSAGFQNYTIGVICSITALGIIVYSLWNELSSKIKYLSLTTLILVFVILTKFSGVDQWSISWNYENVVDSQDTPYNRTTITSAGEQICVFEDGALSYETESESAEEFVQLSTLQADHLKKVLVIGGGFQGIIFELLKLPIVNIDYVEIDRDMIDLVLKHFPSKFCEPMLNKKVNLIIEDPRKFLRRDNYYNIILINMPEPTSAQTNRFYTKEFYRQCSEKLMEDGILAFKIQSAENLWTTSLQRRNGSIYNAVKSAFKNIIVLPGMVNIFVASNSKLSTNTDELIALFNSRKLTTKLVVPQYIKYIFTNDRFTEIRDVLSSHNCPANSDLEPACYGYTISIWLSKFFPELKDFRESFLTAINSNNSLIIGAIIILTGLFFAGRQYNQLNRLVIVFGVSFIGMATETLLLILYQTKNGVLYRDIGILLMMFMLGLSLGALAINLLYKSHKIKFSKSLGFGLLSAFVMLNIGIYFLTKTNLPINIISISGTLLINGFFVSAIFAFVSLNKVSNQLEQVKPLYSADLIGGSLGSITMSLILIPILGLPTTLILISILALIIFVFLL